MLHDKLYYSCELYIKRSLSLIRHLKHDAGVSSCYSYGTSDFTIFTAVT